MGEPAKLVEWPRLIEPEGLSASFHMLNRVIPDDQVVCYVTPETSVDDALDLMRSNGFSQLPVVEGTSVLGLFSYRAFALGVARLGDRMRDPASLPVEEFLDEEHPVAFARLRDEFRRLLGVLDDKGCVIVSGPEDLVGVVTPMDVLRYLHAVTEPFILIEEIELAIRALISDSISDPNTLERCVETALSNKYEVDALPTNLHDMTFDDYVAIIRDGRNWKHVATAFGGTRDRARGRLEPVGAIRNRAFHFRGVLTNEDRRLLKDCRDWLLRCVRKVEARKAGDQ